MFVDSKIFVDNGTHLWIVFCGLQLIKSNKNVYCLPDGVICKVNKHVKAEVRSLKCISGVSGTLVSLSSVPFLFPSEVLLACCHIVATWF